jgi:hypothetical protein
MLDIITPAEAFRLFLSARYRRTSLEFTDKIQSNAWFWYPSSSGAPTFLHAAAKASIGKLSRYTNAGDVRLRRTAPP